MSKAKVGESPTTVVSEEEFEAEETEMDLDFLKGGYIRLNRARKESDGKLDEVSQQLRAILQILEKPEIRSSVRPNTIPE